MKTQYLPSDVDVDINTCISEVIRLRKKFKPVAAAQRIVDLLTYLQSQESQAWLVIKTGASVVRDGVESPATKTKYQCPNCGHLSGVATRCCPTCGTPFFDAEGKIQKRG